MKEILCHYRRIPFPGEVAVPKSGESGETVGKRGSAIGYNLFPTLCPFQARSSDFCMEAIEGSQFLLEALKILLEGLKTSNSREPGRQPPPCWDARDDVE